MSKIQSVLFDREICDIPNAKVWLDEHHLEPIKKADITKRFIHFRIRNPNEFNRIRTMKTSKGIEFHIGFMGGGVTHFRLE